MHVQKPSRLVCATLVVACLAGLPGAALAENTLAEPEKWTDRAPDSYRAKFECSNGTFVVEVDRNLAPGGADRFYNLVRSGFFDGARFFRVAPGFVVQFGLSGTPEVDSAWFRARIPDDPVKGSNTTGTMTFATSGANSRTTQVFINLGNNKRLDAMGFAPFGRVVEGMDVVAAISPKYAETRNCSQAGTCPSQGSIRREGNAYLEEKFPGLDYVKKATIVGSSR